jgi:hypothetical protein
MGVLEIGIADRVEDDVRAPAVGEVADVTGIGFVLPDHADNLFYSASTSLSSKDQCKA